MAWRESVLPMQKKYFERENYIIQNQEIWLRLERRKSRFVNKAHENYEIFRDIYEIYWILKLNIKTEY